MVKHSVQLDFIVDGDENVGCCFPEGNGLTVSVAEGNGDLLRRAVTSKLRYGLCRGQHIRHSGPDVRVYLDPMGVSGINFAEAMEYLFENGWKLEHGTSFDEAKAIQQDAEAAEEARPTKKGLIAPKVDGGYLDTPFKKELREAVSADRNS